MRKYSDSLIKYFAGFFLLFFISVPSLFGQDSATKRTGGASDNDSLSLEHVIKEIISNHPAIMKFKEGINSAEAAIGLAKTAYYPNVAFKASYTNIGPVQEIAIPGMGVFKLYPMNNYDADINLNENIYDFGKTSSRIDMANQGKNIAEETVENIKQNLSLAAVNIYYSLLFIQEAIAIKDSEIITLKEHLDFLQKKEAAGAATQFEILTTKVKISNAENQQTDLVSSQLIALAKLNSLMGKPPLTKHIFSEDGIGLASQNQGLDYLTSFAISHRNDLIIANDNLKMKQLNYSMINTENNPVINIFGDAGYKNGFLPELNKMTANYVAGIGFTYPLFDAFRTKQNLMAAQTEISSAQDEIEINKRKVTDEVVEASEDVDKDNMKIEHLKLQLNQSKEALSLAKTSYEAGALTNLDMLDASTNVAESGLMLLKARIDLVIDTYKLKAAIGEKIY